MNVRAAMSGVLGVWSIACGAGGDPNTHSTVDAAGAAMVVTTPPYPQWRLIDPPLLHIGGGEGDAAYDFFGVVFAGSLTDSRVVVLDGSLEIRWFSPSGVYRSTLGGKGEGPGQFRAFDSAMLTAADSVIIFDRFNQRLTWVSPDERTVREESTSGLFTGRVNLLGVWSGGRLVVAERRHVPSMVAPGLNYTRDSLQLMLYSAGQTTVLTKLEADESSTFMRFVDGRPIARMEFGLGFGYKFLTGATRQSIALAPGEEQGLVLLNSAGATIRRARRSDITAVPISDEDAERYVEYWLGRLRTREARALNEVATVRRQEMALLAPGHSVPSFDRLLVDPADRIWLRNYSPPWMEKDSVIWTVFSADGRVSAELAVAAGLEVMHVGNDRVTVVARDDNDVESVKVYRIERFAAHPDDV